MDYLQPVLHLGQAGLAGYSLFHAYIAITNLRKFEEKTEKAAEWSTTAEHELHKTRTTQTSGTLAILSSFVISLGLTFSSSQSTFVKLLVNAANIAVCVFTRAHIANFWAHKAKVPFVQGYNDAITSTNVIKEQLGFLASSWILTSLVEAWRLGRG